MGIMRKNIELELEASFNVAQLLIQRGKIASVHVSGNFAAPQFLHKTTSTRCLNGSLLHCLIIVLIINQMATPVNRN